MIGLINLSGVGIIVLGGLIALIIYSTPKLKFLASHPLVAFVVGIIIAYILDDFSDTITPGDVIVITLMIVTLIVMLLPMLKDWLKSKREKIENIHTELNKINNKISKIDGQIETILHLSKKK